MRRKRRKLQKRADIECTFRLVRCSSCEQVAITPITMAPKIAVPFPLFNCGEAAADRSGKSPSRTILEVKQTWHPPTEHGTLHLCILHRGPNQTFQAIWKQNSHGRRRSLGSGPCHSFYLRRSAQVNKRCVSPSPFSSSSS